jgi:hypothetical protein
MVHLDLIRQPFNLLAEKSDGVPSTIAAGSDVWVIFHSCELFSLSAMLAESVATVISLQQSTARPTYLHVTLTNRARFVVLARIRP